MKVHISKAIGGAAVALAAVAALIKAAPGDGPAPAAPLASSSATSVRLPSPSGRRGREQLVGSATCAPCHKPQSDAYAGSHHQKALLRATSGAAEVRFDGGRFTSKLGGATAFALRDGAGVVTSPTLEGKPQTLPIAYISGVWPLEQYVVQTERGKLQSLGVVRDTRVETPADQRWLHVYGPAGIAPSDPLFFTSPAQNWNHICADCHSTWVERRYDASADSFDTRWAELSVGCEACHGPGAEHVRSAQTGGPVTPLGARLRRAEPWVPSATGSPTPRDQDGAEVEACAPCHSRREPLKEGFLAGDQLLDHFEPELLRSGSYHPDGQVEGEVYEWGSFLQSRMYAAGVRCSDCHEPHSGKPHASGNALCARCHEPSRFDVAAHTHHAGAKAPLCIDCHMPPATFMQIDERRDHSIRIPRPDHSVEHGTPNACNRCHRKESAVWARDHVARWFPVSTRRPHFVRALSADRRGDIAAPALLRALLNDQTVPAIAHASALDRLGRYAGPATASALRAALGNSNPLIVHGAVLGIAQLAPEQRAPLLLPSLERLPRASRIAAARALAGVRLTTLLPPTRAALERAFAEVEDSFALGASRPESHVERSAFALARGRLEDAEKALNAALRLQPCLVEAHLNFADLERQRQREPAAQQSIERALACDPRSAAAHHALGLWKIRAKQRAPAIASLRKAAELAPNEPRFAYVLAVALADAEAGDRDAAIRVLERALTDHPNDHASLRALIGYVHDAGDVAKVTKLRRQLDILLGDTTVRGGDGRSR